MKKNSEPNSFAQQCKLLWAAEANRMTGFDTGKEGGLCYVGFLFWKPQLKKEKIIKVEIKGRLIRGNLDLLDKSNFLENLQLSLLLLREAGTSFIAYK